MEHLTIMAQRTMEDMPPAKGLVLKVAQAVDTVMAAVCKFMILSTTLVLLVLLGANVAARYVFHEGGIEWISEVPAQLFPWLIAGGIVMATLRGGHIAVEFAYSILGERQASALAIFIQSLIIVAYAVLFIVANDVAQVVAVERSPLLHISGSWGYYALMFAAGGTVATSATILLRVILLGRAGLPQPNPEESSL